MTARHRIRVWVVVGVATAAAQAGPQIAGNFGIDCEGACKLTFSVDIGSARELSSPIAGAVRGFDPGDVYDYMNPYAPLTACDVVGGADGIGDDYVFLALAVDPAPSPPDTTYATAVPVGDGCDPNIQSCYDDFFDLDGHDLLNVDLRLKGLNPDQPLDAALLISDFTDAERANIFEVSAFFISFDDDAATGWPDASGSVPVNSTPASGATYGKTTARDEVIGVRVECSAGVCTTLYEFPIGHEEWVHQEFRANPDVSEEHDDDIDSIDYITSGAQYLYFTPDHEATLALQPGAIYMNGAAGSGPILMIRPEVHLGLTPTVDIDACQFVWMDGGLVLLFSVDVDDPLTLSRDESAGLRPNVVYGSTLTGAYSVVLEDDAVLVDNIDAIGMGSLEYEPRPTRMYGVTTGGEFLEIDKSSGAGASLGNIGYPGNAMDADPDGRIFVMQSLDKLIEVDPNSPSTPTVTPLDVPDEGLFATGLAIGPAGQFRVAVNAGASDNDLLYSLDSGAGSYELICEFDGLTEVEGLTFDRCGLLYGLDSEIGTFRVLGVYEGMCVIGEIGDCNTGNRTIEFDLDDNLYGARFALLDVDLMGQCCAAENLGATGYDVRGLAVRQSDCDGTLKGSYAAGHTIKGKLIDFAPFTTYEILLEDAAGNVVDLAVAKTGSLGRASVKFTTYDCADRPFYLKNVKCGVSVKVKKLCL